MPHVTETDRARAAGRATRTTVPRRAHARAAEADRDPMALFGEQNLTRLPELVPLRYERMTESPFAYYRGSAGAMALDLSNEPVTGLNVMASGDAHLANFGFFASPERRLLFDLNDFDESHPAPWEWDVKRLAASVWIGARHNGYSEAACRDATVATVHAYREGSRRLSTLTATERFFLQVDSDLLEGVAPNPDRMRSMTTKARGRTSEKMLRKLTVTTESGAPRIVDQPPIVQHLGIGSLDGLETLVQQYASTLRADVRVLLQQYRVVDFAMRIVGVGSVGTRCFVVLLLGPSDEPLFLQVKEAGPSVLATYGGVADPHRVVEKELRLRGQGARVVGAQRILQAQSDPFLGWLHGAHGFDGVRRDFYIRQFRDMKGSVEFGDIEAGAFVQYGRLCGYLLARAHSQSPRGAFIAGYLGKSDVFDEAVADWSRTYADRIESDWELLCRIGIPSN